MLLFKQIGQRPKEESGDSNRQSEYKANVVVGESLDNDKVNKRVWILLIFVVSLLLKWRVDPCRRSSNFCIRTFNFLIQVFPRSTFHDSIILLITIR